MKKCLVLLTLLCAPLMAQSERAYLGINMQDLDNAKREKLAYDGAGVLIERVVDHSAATEAGLMVGDVLVSIDGDEMSSSREVIEKIGMYQPGDVIQIRDNRNGRRRR